MARMWGLSHHGRCLGGGLLGGCLALVLTAAPAVAELSSVDAYGGQAQVLGKPIHRHVRSGGSPAQGSGRQGGQGAGTSGSRAGSGGAAETSAGSGSHTNTGSGAGTPATPSAVGGAAGGGAASQGSGAEGAHRGGNGATSTTTNGASGAPAGGQGRPVVLADSAAVSNGSLSLSAPDVLALLAIFAGLAAVGVGIRRWSRQGE